MNEKNLSLTRANMADQYESAAFAISSELYASNDSLNFSTLEANDQVATLSADDQHIVLKGGSVYVICYEPSITELTATIDEAYFQALVNKMMQYNSFIVAPWVISSPTSFTGTFMVTASTDTDIAIAFNCYSHQTADVMVNIEGTVHVYQMFELS